MVNLGQKNTLSGVNKKEMKPLPKFKNMPRLLAS